MSDAVLTTNVVLCFNKELLIPPGQLVVTRMTLRMVCTLYRVSIALKLIRL